VHREFLIRELGEINPRLTDAVSDITAQQLLAEMEREEEKTA
jgi:7,8-dihydro-6-hydroxymethylpterin-pyrophosphokinase